MAGKKIAILGGGNIGCAIAIGLAKSGDYAPGDITITRRNVDALAELKSRGFDVSADNKASVAGAEVVLLAIQPQQLDTLLDDVAPVLDGAKHLVISVVSGVGIAQIARHVGKPVEVVRAMPNTAIAIQESMTCLATATEAGKGLQVAREIFDRVGTTLVIKEDLMGAATALCACGIAFFLRVIRAASQGGIEIGFHAEEAILMAAQTARGAASLLTSAPNHPEREIDKVTTPRGITITGLNEMEHRGLSSAMIKGITTSAEKAGKIYVEKKE